MPHILESLSHPSLEKATEITYQMAMTYLGRIFAARFYHESGARWFVTEPRGFNMVISTSFTTNTPRSTIDETLKQIAISSAGSMTWDIPPSIRSTSLDECLHANGWSRDGEVRSMVLDLHALKKPMQSPA